MKGISEQTIHNIRYDVVKGLYQELNNIVNKAQKNKNITEAELTMSIFNFFNTATLHRLKMDSDYVLNTLTYNYTQSKEENKKA